MALPSLPLQSPLHQHIPPARPQSGLYTALDLSSSSTLYLQVISTTNINLTAEQLKDLELCSGQSLKVRLISPKTKGQSAGVCKSHADSLHSEVITLSEAPEAGQMHGTQENPVSLPYLKRE